MTGRTATLPCSAPTRRSRWVSAKGFVFCYDFFHSHVRRLSPAAGEEVFCRDGASLERCGSEGRDPDLENRQVQGACATTVLVLGCMERGRVGVPVLSVILLITKLSVLCSR